MSLIHVALIYGVIFCALLALLIRLLIKRRANRPAATAGSPRRNFSWPQVDWKSLRGFSPRHLLTGEMWLKVLIAALVALSAAVIVVVFVFPLGAFWAALGAFTAVVAVVGVFFMLME